LRHHQLPKDTVIHHHQYNYYGDEKSLLDTKSVDTHGISLFVIISAFVAGYFIVLDLTGCLKVMIHPQRYRTGFDPHAVAETSIQGLLQPESG
jgi:hypothetical protein